MLHKHFKSAWILGLAAAIGLLGVTVLTALPGEPLATRHGAFGINLSAVSAAGPQFDGDLIGEMLFGVSMLWIDW
jgi:hypothetical protein